MLVVVCWSLCATAHCVCARNLCKLVHAAGGVRVSLGLVLSRRFVLWWLNSATDVQHPGSHTATSSPKPKYVF